MRKSLTSRAVAHGTSIRLFVLVSVFTTVGYQITHPSGGFGSTLKIAPGEQFGSVKIVPGGDLLLGSSCWNSCQKSLYT